MGGVAVVVGGGAPVAGHDLEPPVGPQQHPLAVAADLEVVGVHGEVLDPLLGEVVALQVGLGVRVVGCGPGGAEHAAHRVAQPQHAVLGGAQVAVAGGLDRERHDAVAAAFAAATGAGDFDALVAVLDPNVALTSDGGGKVSAARRPVLGAVNVARFLLGVLRQRPQAQAEPIITADGLGFLVSEAGVVDTVIVLGVRADRVCDVWLVRNPDKLTNWR